eukprot:870557_1
MTSPPKMNMMKRKKRKLSLLNEHKIKRYKLNRRLKYELHSPLPARFQACNDTSPRLQLLNTTQQHVSTSATSNICPPLPALPPRMRLTSKKSKKQFSSFLKRNKKPSIPLVIPKRSKSSTSKPQFPNPSNDKQSQRSVASHSSNTCPPINLHGSRRRRASRRTASSPTCTDTCMHRDDLNLEDIDLSAFNAFLPTQDPESETESTSLNDFIESMPSSDFKDSIPHLDDFRLYHDALLRCQFRILSRSDTQWILPAYSIQKRALSAHKYVHVTEQSDGLCCSCSSKDFATDNCIHIPIVELMVVHGNPTQLAEGDASGGCADFKDANLYLIEASDKKHISSVWSVDTPLSGGLGIVHINESHGNVTCSEHGNLKQCPHSIAVQEYVYEHSDGLLDIRAILRKKKTEEISVYDKDTGEILVEHPKDLSCLSRERIPIPHCFATRAEMEVDEYDKYYQSKPLHMRQLPQNLVPHSS